MKKAIYSKEQNTLVKKLISAREEMMLTQEEVANKLNRSQSYISKIEAGQRRIDVIQLKEFSKLYKKSVDYFLKD